MVGARKVAVLAGRESGKPAELLMVGRRTREARGEADIESVAALGEQRAGIAPPLALQEGGRRQVMGAAKELVQLGHAHAAGTGQRGRVGELGGSLAQALDQPVEEVQVPVLAPVEILGPAALAGTQSGAHRLLLIAEEAHV